MGCASGAKFSFRVFSPLPQRTTAARCAAATPRRAAAPDHCAALPPAAPAPSRRSAPAPSRGVELRPQTAARFRTKRAPRTGTMPRLKSASVAHMGGVCELTYDTTGAHMVTCGADSFTKVRVGRRAL